MRALLLVPALLFGASFAHAAPVLPGDDVPSAAQASFARAQAFETGGQLRAAADSYRAALKQAGAPCAACSEGLVRVQLAMEDYSGAAATAEKLAGSTSAAAASHAHMLAGQAFYRGYFASLNGEGTTRKDAKKAAALLESSEADLAAALAADPANEPARALHARVLAALHRDSESSREFTACASAAGASAAECARAGRLAHAVESARLEPAPPFEAETMDGHKVSLDSLGGKVVLIDFWATWCTFCRRDSDYVQSMLDSFDAREFALLEVDVDDSAEKWRSYVKQNRLEGLQVHDRGTTLQSAFHVKGFPTYIVLDANGTERFRISGAQGDLRAEIRKLIAEAKASSGDTQTRAKTAE